MSLSPDPQQRVLDALTDVPTTAYSKVKTWSWNPNDPVRTLIMLCGSGSLAVVTAALDAAGLQVAESGATFVVVDHAVADMHVLVVPKPVEVGPDGSAVWAAGDAAHPETVPSVHTVASFGGSISIDGFRDVTVDDAEVLAARLIAAVLHLRTEAGEQRG